jgi:putative MATE family efflux protein
VSNRLPKLFDADDRRLLRLAGPAFLTLSAEPLYVLVDTAIVGHIGTSELGGLAIAGTVLSTLTWLIAFLASGVTTQVAQRRGAGDDAGARSAVSQGLVVAVSLGALTAAVAGFGARPVARLVGGKGDVLHAAITYLRIASLGLPAIALGLLATGWYRGIEDLRLPVRLAIGTNIANVILEMIFVWLFHWGIAGSAIGTVLVQWAAVLVYVTALRGVIHIEAPQPERLRALLRIGVAMVIRTALMVSTLTGATWLASRIDDMALGAHQIGVQIFLLFALMIDALAVSSQSVFANRMGTSNAGTTELWGVTKRLIRLGVIVGIGLGLVLVVVSPVLGHAFSGDAAVVSRSVPVLLWAAALQVTGAVVFVLDGVLMGADLFPWLAGGAFVAAAGFWAFAGFQRTSLPIVSGLSGVWVAVNVWMVLRLVGNLSIARRFIRPQS